MPNTTTLPQDLGPWGSIFNYDEEVKKEEAKHAQLAESEKKIMRTNSIGDAFRLLIDGVGGSMGATITPKGVNPGIMNASSRLTALGKEFDAKLERLRMTDLAIRGRGIEWNENNKRYQDQKAQQEVDRQTGNTRYEEQKTIQANNRKEDRANKLADEASQLKSSMALQDNSAKNTQATNDKYIQSQLAALNKSTSRVDRTKAYAKDDIPFVTPDKKTIWINPSEIQALIPMLIGDKKKWDQSLDAAQKALLTNEAIKEGTILKTLYNNWDAVKKYFGYAEAATIQQANSPLLPGYVAPTPGGYTGPVPVKGGYTGAQPAQAAPKVETPDQLAASGFDGAKKIYDNGNSVEEVTQQLKDYVNTTYPNADPATKSAICNSLINKF